MTYKVYNDRTPMQVAPDGGYHYDPYEPGAKDAEFDDLEEAKKHCDFTDECVIDSYGNEHYCGTEDPQLI